VEQQRSHPFYAACDTFGDLTGERDFNQFLARAAKYDPAKLTDIANQASIPPTFRPSTK
jgi:hypothetical protein